MTTRHSYVFGTGCHDNESTTCYSCKEHRANTHFSLYQKHSRFSTGSVLVFFLFNYPNNLTFPPFYIVTTICTVLLLIPNILAVCRTVALFSTIYSAIRIARSSIYPFKKISCVDVCTFYAKVVFLFFNSFSSFVMINYKLYEFNY